MASAPLADDMRRMQYSLMQELVKVQVSMREQFRQQLVLEQQDRQVAVAELQRSLQAHEAALEKLSTESDTATSAPASGGIPAASAMLASSRMSRVNEQVDKLRKEVFGGLAELRQRVEEDSAKQNAAALGFASKSDDLQRKLSEAESGKQSEQAQLEKFKQDVFKQLVNVQTSTASAQATSERHQHIFEQQIFEQQAALQKLQQDFVDQRSKLTAELASHQTGIAKLEAGIAKFEQDLSNKQLQQKSAVDEVKTQQLSAQQAAVEHLQQELEHLQQELFAQRSQQNTAVQACRETSLATARECEQLALKTSAAETELANLQHSFHERMTSAATVQQEFKSELNAQRMQLVEQSSRFTAVIADSEELKRQLLVLESSFDEQGSKVTGVAADSEELKLKLSVLEASFDKTCALIDQKAESAIAKESAIAGFAKESARDLSMQSELHGHFVGLKDTVAQLRSEMAVTQNMIGDLAVQRARLDNFSHELAEVTAKLRDRPATGPDIKSTPTIMMIDDLIKTAETRIKSELREDFNSTLMGLREGVETLQNEMQSNFESLRANWSRQTSPNTDGSSQKTRLASTWTDSCRMDNLEEQIQKFSSAANRIDDVVQLSQVIITGAQRANQDVVESKHHLMHLDTRVRLLEKMVPDSVSTQCDATSSSISEPLDASRAATEAARKKALAEYATLQERFAKERPKQAEGAERVVPTDDRAAEQVARQESLPFLSNELKDTLFHLVNSIQQTVSTDAKNVAGSTGLMKTPVDRQRSMTSPGGSLTLGVMTTPADAQVTVEIPTPGSLTVRSPSPSRTSPVAGGSARMPMPGSSPLLNTRPRSPVNRGGSAKLQNPGNSLDGTRRSLGKGDAVAAEGVKSTVDIKTSTPSTQWRTIGAAPLSASTGTAARSPIIEARQTRVGAVPFQGRMASQTPSQERYSQTPSGRTVSADVVKPGRVVSRDAVAPSQGVVSRVVSRDAVRRP